MFNKYYLLTYLFFSHGSDTKGVRMTSNHRVSIGR